MKEDRKALDIGVYGARAIPSTYGGYETFLTTLLPELARRGHRVTMYCRKSHIDATDPYRDVTRVAIPGIETKQLSTMSHGALATVAARLHGHDVVLVVNIANAFFAWFNRLTGQRVVLNTDGQEWLRDKWGPVGKAAFRSAARIAPHAASALVADSNGMRLIYLDASGVDSTVIPYPYPDAYSKEIDDSVLDSWRLAPGGYIVVAGRLVPENNAHRILEAYLKANTSMPVLVLGEANYASPVLRRIREIASAGSDVRIGGHVDDRAAYLTLISRAAAYVHGHSVGGINPALIEAMGSGALTLASDTAFNREALGEAGLYFADFDASLVRLLRDLPNLPTERTEELRNNSRRRAEERFRIDQIADAYEALFLAASSVSPWRRTSLRTGWQ